MIHHLRRAGLVAVLLALGWAAGRAEGRTPPQAPLMLQPARPALSGDSDFELLVRTVSGETEVRCLRGCKLTWAPTMIPPDGQVEMLAPDLKVNGQIGSLGCLATTWMPQNCHILGWKR